MSPAHWAPKRGKREGRPIMDSSDGQDEGLSLNSDEVTAAAEERWGPIKHPTIDQIVRMLLDFKDKYPDRPWSDVEFWKMDLRGAFTLMSFRADNCQLFASEMVGDLVIIFLCGLFGWTATPAAFQVITRALLYEFEFVLLLAVLMYVDDVMAASLKEHGPRDRRGVTRVVEALLGKGAIAEDKTEHSSPESPRVDAIGFTVDMERQVVTISRRNLLRALYLFFSTDPDALVPVKRLEQLASLASRYGQICGALRPFTRALYCAYAGRLRHTSVRLEPGARRAVRLWRAMLCALRLREAAFARPFETFRLRLAAFVVQYDASLSGIGIEVYQRTAPGGWATIGGGEASLGGYDLGGDSAYQNSAEFIAGLVGIVGLIRWCRRRGVPLDAVILRGDSITALRWGETQRFRGESAESAAALFALVLSHYCIQVTEVIHVAGVDNTRCDTLSRIEGKEGLRVEDVLGEGMDWGFGGDEVVREVLRLCNPKGVDRDDRTFEGFWRDAVRCVESIGRV